MTQKMKVKKIAGINKQQSIVQTKGALDNKNNGCGCGCIPNQKD